MSIHVRPYAASDLPAMNEIWNEVVREGYSLPPAGTAGRTHWRGIFLRRRPAAPWRRDENTGEILGLYILHPNNVGRCGHIANASFAVGSERSAGGTLAKRWCAAALPRPGLRDSASCSSTPW